MPADIQATIPGSAIQASPFNVPAAQQASGSPTDGVFTIQFSNDSGGPWSTSRPTTGPVQATQQPWSVMDVSLVVSVVMYSPAWIRIGVWADGLNPDIDTPTYASNTRLVLVGSAGAVSISDELLALSGSGATAGKAESDATTSAPGGGGASAKAESARTSGTVED